MSSILGDGERDCAHTLEGCRRRLAGKNVTAASLVSDLSKELWSPTYRFSGPLVWDLSLVTEGVEL